LYSVANLYQPIYAIDDFNFAAVGDFGCTTNTDQTVDNIIDKNPEFVFALGDFSYKSTGKCWFNRIDPIDNITRISIGCHDDEDSEGFNGYMDHFALSRTFYSFDYKNTHVLVLDTQSDIYSADTPQYDFAVNDLQTASQDPNIDWIIVYFHSAFYTSPAVYTVSPELRDTVHPLFDQYGVDLVLTADLHNYQRTFPLKYNTTNPSDPIITGTDSNDYTDPEGEIYAIVGTGGFSLHPFSGKASFVSSQQDDFYGQLDIKITDNGNKLEGKFYRNGDNAILDNFTITKGNSSPET
jgi:hypothetical protein